MRKALRRNWNQFLWTAAAAVLAAVFLGLFEMERPKAPADGKRVPPAASEPLTQAAAPVPAKVQDRPDVIEPAFLPQTLELEPPYQIIDGLTFAAGRVTIRLSGVEGPPATAACRDDAGLLWACGLQARAALNNELRKRNVHCIPTGTAPSAVIEATCHIDGTDVVQRLLSAGWARPLSNRGERSAEEAQRARRGLWNGNWSVVELNANPDARPGLRQALDGMSP
jgi:endonuclease YncB( thermonuclease family)